MENNLICEQDTDCVAIAEPEIKENNMSNKDINFIVLAIESPFFNINRSSYELDVCGKPMIEWVENACEKLPTIKRVPFKHNLLKEIKPLLNNSEWTIVLFSDTPLLTRKTIEQAFSIAETKGLNVLKLTRGFVFNTEYVSRVEEIFGIETYYLEEEDFVMASNFKQLSIVRDIMKNRICEHLYKQGVNIVDPSSTFIDAQVSIGRNTTIFPNNRIYGKVQIAEDCKISSNNTIEDCVIYKNSIIENCTIKNSVLGENCVAINSCIEDSILVGKDNCITNYSNIEKVQSQSKIKVTSGSMKNVQCDGFIVLRSGAKAIVDNGRIRIFGNNTLCENSSIVKPVCVGENAVIEANIVVVKDIPATKK